MAQARWFHEVDDRSGHGDLMDLRGDLLAWAARGSGSVDLLLTNLTTGDTRLVTSVPSPAGQVTVSSLAFDGRWLAWADDREGNPDVFAVDTLNNRLYPLTDHPAADDQVDVDGGRVVWVRGGDLLMGDLEAGTVSLLRRGVGPQAHPTIDGDVVAWSQSTGSAPYILVHEIGGNRSLFLAPLPLGAHVRPQLSREHLIWSTRVYEQNTSSPRVVGTLVRLVHLDTTNASRYNATLRELTPAPGAVDAPSVGGHWAAWLEADPDTGVRLHVLNLETGVRFFVPGPVSRGHLSDSHLVVVRASSGWGPVLAMSWEELESEEDGGLVSWPFLAAGLGLVVAGVWGISRRRRM